MGAYIINIPDTVDRIIYVHVYDKTGTTAIASHRVEDLTPYTEPDMEQVREEAYEKGKMDAYVEDGKNITVLKKEAEEAYQRGLNDAKEGKATCQYCEYQYLDDTEEPCKKCCKAYMNKFKPKAKEEQIQVGDEVDDGVANLIVLEINQDGTVSGFDDEGSIIHATPRKKTGRHFPEIAEVLQKMKENNDNK